MPKLGEAFVVIRAALGPLKTGLAAARSAVTKAMSTIINTIKKAMSITYKYIKRSMLAISAAIGYATYAFGDFERAMRKATAVSDVTEKQFRKMSEMARAEAIRLNLDATQAADAFYFLGSAGLSVKQQMEAFVPVLTLVKAGVSSVGETAENLVDIMVGFKIPFTQAGYVADVLAKAATSAQATLAQFADALKEVSGIGRMTHNTLEEMTSAIAVLASVGFKGSRAGFMMRRILLRLMAPMSDVRKLMDKYRISIYNSQGKMKPFIRLVGELSEALKGVGEEQRNIAFKTIFGQRAIAGQIQIFDKGEKALGEYTQSLKDSADTAQKIADKQLNSLLEQFGRLRKMLKDIFITVGGALAPAFRMLIDILQEANKKTGDFVKKNQASITKWAVIIATRINFVRGVLQDFAVGAYKNWPETWKFMKDVAVGQLDVIWKSFKLQIKTSLDIAIKLFTAFGKSLGHIFGKIWSDFENRAMVAGQRAISKQIEYNREYRKALIDIRKETGHKGIFTTAEARKEAAKRAAEAVALAEKQGIFKVAFPTIPTETWGAIGENIKREFVPALEFAKSKLKEMQDTIAELQEKYLARITLKDEISPALEPARKRLALLKKEIFDMKGIGEEKAWEILVELEKSIATMEEKIKDKIKIPDYITDALKKRLKEMRDFTEKLIREIDEMEKVAGKKAAPPGIAGEDGRDGVGGRAGAGAMGHIGFVGLKEAWKSMAQSLQPKDKTQEDILKESAETNDNLVALNESVNNLNVGMTA